MASLKSALIALALTTSADAKRNRRLADRLDVAKIAEDAEEGKLSSRVLFKIDDDHRDDAETNALSPSSSSVLSRAVFLASKFGVQENGTLLQFCNSNSSGSR